MILIRENVERHTDNPAEAKALTKDGYKLVGGEIDEPKEEKILDKMSVKELKALAKSKGIEGADGFTKAELLEVLKEEDDESDRESTGEDTE